MTIRKKKNDVKQATVVFDVVPTTSGSISRAKISALKESEFCDKVDIVGWVRAFGNRDLPHRISITNHSIYYTDDKSLTDSKKRLEEEFDKFLAQLSLKAIRIKVFAP